LFNDILNIKKSAHTFWNPPRPSKPRQLRERFDRRSAARSSRNN